MNVTRIRGPLSNAERSRRWREKRRAPVPATAATAATRRNVPIGVSSTLPAALLLAGVSGGFAIVGMTTVFTGAFWPIVGMGVALEAGKLSAVAWLGQRHAAPRLKVALVTLVAILMLLNSVGAYGFLSKAHIEHALAGDLAVSSRAAAVDARISVQAGIVADLDRRIAQVDTAVEEATRRGRSISAMNLSEQQRHNRAELAAARIREAKTLATLQVERSAVDGERQKVEADLGPVRYLATLIGSTDEATMRWFILVVALLLDPAAVVLLLAATVTRPEN